LPKKLTSVRLWNGEPLPAGLHARLRREWQQLQGLQTRITALGVLRRKQLKTDRVAGPLLTLRGVGESGASVLTSEFFGWRQFHNPRQVGALSGLTPTPHRSGDLIREQGIGKAGNRRVRAVMIQLGWAWLRFQPDAAHPRATIPKSLLIPARERTQFHHGLLGPGVGKRISGIFRFIDRHPNDRLFVSQPYVQPDNMPSFEMTEVAHWVAAHRDAFAAQPVGGRTPS
jgi:hypothetical protein